jgi:hypothetical protein
MAEQTVVAPEIQTPNTTESTRHHERYVAPPVDIHETREGLVVLADVPGVAQEALEVRVDDNVLTIRGPKPDHSRFAVRRVNLTFTQGRGGHAASDRGESRLGSGAWNFCDPIVGGCPEHRTGRQHCFPCVYGARPALCGSGRAIPHVFWIVGRVNRQGGQSCNEHNG